MSEVGHESLERALGDPVLADGFASRYAMASGDDELVELLPFYKCYRAVVRGKVESLRTLKGDPALAAAAEEAVKQWIYEPVRIAGEPVAVLVEIEVNFRLAE